LNRGCEATEVENAGALRAAREAKGWSQDRLGQELGKSKMWVSLIERGKRRPRPADLKQLFWALGLNEEDFG
jgi:transcriptional regulator with XRE-family HTH domain